MMRATTVARSSKSSIEGLLNDSWFRDIRFRAAQKLTESLSLDERAKLLNDVEKSRVRQSIGEAVAEAMAIEVQRNDKELHAAVAKVEEASRAKLENEQMLRRRAEERAAKLALSESLARASSAASANAQHQVDDYLKKPITRPRPPNSAENVDTNSILKHQEHNNNTHPLLGVPLIDLDYKRIYAVKASVLSTIPVWEKQRAYRHDRAKQIAIDKLKNMGIGLPGVISLYEDSSGKLSILDGQHRVGMLTILQQEKYRSKVTFDLDRILVEVFPTAQKNFTVMDETPGHLFTEINKAEPVKLIDMPNVASDDLLGIINQATTLLKDQYPEMFKASSRCRPPHLNVDNLRSDIFVSDIIEKHQIKDPVGLQNILLKKNTEMRKEYEKKSKNIKHNDRVMKKAHQYNFWLGLDNSWLHK